MEILPARSRAALVDWVRNVLFVATSAGIVASARADRCEGARDNLGLVADAALGLFLCSAEPGGGTGAGHIAGDRADHPDDGRADDCSTADHDDDYSVDTAAHDDGPDDHNHGGTDDDNHGGTDDHNHGGTDDDNHGGTDDDNHGGIDDDNHGGIDDDNHGGTDDDNHGGTDDDNHGRTLGSSADRTRHDRGH